MSVPYFPMYPTDFEADTSHLTLEEDGAYNRLLRLMWMTPGCSLPADDRWVMRRMRVDQATFERVVKPLIEEFMTHARGRILSKRLTEEWEKANAAHERRKNAGSKGGKAKCLKTNETEPSNAVALSKQPEPEPYKEREAKASPKKKIGTRLSEDWALPQEWGDWALSEGWPEHGVRLEAEKFRDFWIAKSGRDATKVNWQATWRNWMRNCKSPKVINGGANERPSQNTRTVDEILNAARAR